MKIQSSSQFAVLKASTRFLSGLGVFFASFALVTSNALAEAPPTIGVTVTPDNAFQALFESYGNDNTLLDDWTGADGAMSVLLPDGRVVWDFSDTFLGLVRSDGSRPPGQPFINNSMIVQDGDALGQTLHGGTPASPTSFIIPTDRDSWYWVGDMTVEGDRLRVFVMEFIRTGGGGFDFEWVGNAIASLVLPDLTLESVTPTYGEGDVMYGAALLEEGGYTYIYGTEDVSGTKKYLAHREGNGRKSSWGLGVLHGHRLVVGPERDGAAAEGGRQRLRRDEGRQAIRPLHHGLVDPVQQRAGPVFIDQPLRAVRAPDPCLLDTRDPAGLVHVRRPRPPGVHRRDWPARVVRREHLRPGRFAFRRRQLPPKIYQSKDRALRPGKTAGCSI